MYEYEWTDENDVNIYYQEQKINDEPVSNPTSAKRMENSVPVGVKTYIGQWIVESVESDGVELTTTRLISLINNNIQKIDSEDS